LKFGHLDFEFLEGVSVVGEDEAAGDGGFSQHGGDMGLEVKLAAVEEG